MYRYCIRVVGVGSGNYISFWKCKGLSDEYIRGPNTCDYKINPK